MSARIDMNWSYRGFQAFVLENKFLRIVVLPELGGRIWSILCKTEDRELLWHHPAMPPMRLPYGSNYDNHFFGGWDDIFPNDAPATVAGEEVPDHGEFWSLPFTWKVTSKVQEGKEVALTLGARGPHTGCQLEKTLRLCEREPSLLIDYLLFNPTPADVPYLWKLHPAFAIEPGAKIHLPARRVRTEPEFCSRFSPDVSDFPWPTATGRDCHPLDISITPPPSDRSVDFYYGLNLTSGECGLTFPSGLTVRLTFPTQVYTSVWVFASYGGWRNLYVLLLEPSTGYPYRIDDGLRLGTIPLLRAGQSVEARVALTVSPAAGV